MGLRNLFSRRKPDAGAAAALTPGQAQLKQQAALASMRRGVADVSVSRQRLDLQMRDLTTALAALERVATDADATGDAGAAQTARGRHVIMSEQLGDLRGQRDALAEQERMLIQALTQLQARAAGFTATVGTLSAAQQAAQARHGIVEALQSWQPPENPPR